MRNIIFSFLLFVTVFVVVTLAIVWAPLLFAQRPAAPCAGSRECEHLATGEEKGGPAWEQVDFWSPASEPRLCTVEVATPGSEDGPRNCDHAGIPNAEYLTAFAKTSRIRAAADSIGRVQFLLKRGDGHVKTSCTGFLIAPDAILTAKHCIEVAGASGQPVRAAIRFRYLGAVAEADSVFFDFMPVAIEHAPADKPADFIVLRASAEVAANMAAAGLKALALASEAPSPGEDLFIIGHPFGAGQVVLRAHCRVSSDGAASSMIIEHSCGTASGISGGPIFSDATGRVVGLHIQAQDKIQSEIIDRGYGLPIGLIAERSPTVKALLAPTPPPPTPTAAPTPAPR